jgi:monoamine oxidase
MLRDMTQPITRRRFLHLAGATGGSGALYKAALGLGLVPSMAQGFSRPQLAPLGHARRHVAILGAGIGGLTAAYELTKKGYDCTILEASHRAGGRNLTLRHGDLIDEAGAPQICPFDDEPHLFLNAGPARIPGNHRTLLDYCRELDIELAPFINDNRNTWVQDDAAFGGKPVRNREYVTDARGFMAELAAKGLRTQELDAPLTANDKERLFAFLRSYGDLDESLCYRGSSRAGLAAHDFTRADQRLPIRQFPELLDAEFLWRFAVHFAEGDDQAPTMLEPVGGMDRIVAAFTKHVGGRVKTRAMVESVMLRERGVEIVYRHKGKREKLTADFCLNSIPFQLMAGLEHNFPAAYAGCFTAVPRGKLLKIGLQARERFWEQEGIYGGISWTSQEVTQIWYPAHGIHRRKGVLLAAYCFGGPGAERLEAMPHAERVEAAIRQGEKIHPDYRRYVENGVSIPWHRMNHMLGCASEWNEELRAKWFGTIQASAGRHYMIGDQVSYHPGWQQGAMQSALRAIADIDSHVRSELHTVPGSRVA